jgi:hypothetical protein
LDLEPPLRHPIHRATQKVSGKPGIPWGSSRTDPHASGVWNHFNLPTPIFPRSAGSFALGQSPRPPLPRRRQAARRKSVGSLPTGAPSGHGPDPPPARLLSLGKGSVSRLKGGAARRSPGGEGRHRKREIPWAWDVVHSREPS